MKNSSFTKNIGLRDTGNLVSRNLPQSWSVYSEEEFYTQILYIHFGFQETLCWELSKLCLLVFLEILARAEKFWIHRDRFLRDRILRYSFLLILAGKKGFQIQGVFHHHFVNWFTSMYHYVYNNLSIILDNMFFHRKPVFSIPIDHICQKVPNSDDPQNLL